MSITDFPIRELTPEFDVGSNQYNIKSTEDGVRSGLSITPYNAQGGITIYNTHNTVNYGYTDLLIHSDLPDTLLLTSKAEGSGIQPVTLKSLLTLDSDLILTKTLVFDKQQTSGIKIDPISPVNGWYDIIGDVKLDAESGSNKPNFAVYNDGIKQYQFVVNDQVYINFHMVHDYKMGTDMYIHTHWSTNAASTAGSVTWQFDVMYAKGHQQASFNVPPKIITITQAYDTAYKHMIAETQLSNVGGTGGLLNTNDLEPDGIFLVRTKLITNTMSVAPFVHYVDLHYQSTGIPTKNRAPNFWT